MAHPATIPPSDTAPQPVKTFGDNDKIGGLEGFAQSLKTHAMHEAGLLVDDSLVISLNAPFGSGKTYFLEMFKTQLTQAEDCDVFYLNVWKDDFCHDPFVTLIAAFLEHEETKTPAKREKVALKRPLLDALGEAGNAALAATTGIDARGIVKNIEAREEEAAKEAAPHLGDGVYQAYKQRKRVFAQLESALRAAVTPEKPLFILVDELDRARPDYAVGFLEVLKHFFNVPGIIFILAVDKAQLEASVRCQFGAINFPEYYRKFAHRQVSLSGLGRASVLKYINHKIDALPKRGYVLDLEESRINAKFFLPLCIGFESTPRQIDEMLRILSYFLIGAGSSDYVLNEALAATLYAVLQVHEEALAEKILKSEDCLEEVFRTMYRRGIVKNRDLDFKETRFVPYSIFCFFSAEEHCSQNNTGGGVRKLLRTWEKATEGTERDWPKNVRDDLETKIINHWEKRRNSYTDARPTIQIVAQRINNCMSFFDEDK